MKNSAESRIRGYFSKLQEEVKALELHDKIHVQETLKFFKKELKKNK